MLFLLFSATILTRGGLIRLSHIKEKLRKLGIENLQKIARSEQKQQKEQKIYQQLFQSNEWQQAKVVGLTMANEIEVATTPIIEKAWEEGKTILVPKTLPERQMCFF